MLINTDATRIRTHAERDSDLKFLCYALMSVWRKSDRCRGFDASTLWFKVDAKPHGSGKYFVHRVECFTSTRHLFTAYDTQQIEVAGVSTRMYRAMLYKPTMILTLRTIECILRE